MSNPIKEAQAIVRRQAELLNVNNTLEEYGRQLSEVARLKTALRKAADALRNTGDHKAAREALAALYYKESK